MPKTQYKYLTFIKEAQPGKTSVWQCCNTKSGTSLGIVKWFGDWRQYCYFPTVQAVYSAGCLRDIADFMEQLRRERNES